MFLSMPHSIMLSFVCALQESVSPILCKFCNQSQILWEFSVPLLDPQVGKSGVGPRTFLTVREFPWYNCSAVCGSSVGQLKSNSFKRAHATGCVPRELHAEPLPCGRPLLTRASTGDSETGWSVSVGSLGPGVHKVLFEPYKSL